MNGAPRSTAARFAASPWTAFVPAVAPAVAAVGSTDWFVTQDGPSHLYNAHILVRTIRGDEAFASAFEVRRLPLPNWSGHLAAGVFDALLPPREGERALACLTLVAFAASCFGLWLSAARPEERRRAWIPAVFCVLLGLNVTWLLGFTSFLLGAALTPATLAFWSAGIDRAGPGRSLGLAGLLVIGYFCHPIGLGITVVGLTFLTAATASDRRRSFAALAVGLTPLVPLGACYFALTRRGGGPAPIWEKLRDPLSLADWRDQLGWVDPISLAGKTFRPFSGEVSAWNGLASPVLWLVAGVVLLLLGAGPGDARRRAWGRLSALLILGGIVAPDTLGENHGHYLPQRIVLLGLAVLPPALDFSGRLRGAGGFALATALAIQVAWVRDYALEAARSASAFLAAKPAIGTGKRVATILTEPRNRFRANPMLHLDSLFGVDTGNVLWTNYEAGHYYFPIRLRDPERSPRAIEFENISKIAEPSRSAERARKWADLLDRSADQIDVLVSWGNDPAIEAVNAARFARAETSSGGKVRIWSGRGAFARGGAG